MDDKAAIKAACKSVGCKEKDVMHSRITESDVILVVLPAGQKHIVPLADLETPAPVTAKAVEAEKPAKASKK